MESNPIGLPISLGALRYSAPRPTARPTRVTGRETNVRMAGRLRAAYDTDAARVAGEHEAVATGLYPRVVATHRPIDLPLFDSASHTPVDSEVEGFVPRSLGTTLTSKGVLGTLTPNPGLDQRQNQILKSIADRESDVYVGPAWVKTV